MKKNLIFLFCIFILIGCATMKNKPTSFLAPENNPHRVNYNGAIIACETLDTAEASKKQFNIDFNAKKILPVRLIVRNSGQQDIRIISSQVFGVLADGSFYNALTLDQSLQDIGLLENVKGSARGAAVGSLVGATAGAAGGAIFGKNSSSTATGAAIGGVAGAVIGGAGGKESIATYLDREMQDLAWVDRVVFPGYIMNGFIFLPKADYQKIELGILNSANKMERVTINLK
ncbi:MAG TPA: hypothetical protein PLC32_01715 [Candidatus Omnitrophota bacterium]|nr:hypothetical protein [Candidatus Omnitrophota bacterium]